MFSSRRRSSSREGSDTMLTPPQGSVLEFTRSRNDVDETMKAINEGDLVFDESDRCRVALRAVLMPSNNENDENSNQNSQNGLIGGDAVLSIDYGIDGFAKVDGNNLLKTTYAIGPNGGLLMNFTLSNSGLPLGLILSEKNIGGINKNKNIELTVSQLSNGHEASLIGLKLKDRIHAINNKIINNKLSAKKILSQLKTISKPANIMIERFVVAGSNTRTLGGRSDKFATVSVWRLSSHDAHGDRSYEDIVKMGREVVAQIPTGTKDIGMSFSLTCTAGIGYVIRVIKVIRQPPQPMGSTSAPILILPGDFLIGVNHRSLRELLPRFEEDDGKFSEKDVMKVINALRGSKAKSSRNIVLNFWRFDIWNSAPTNSLPISTSFTNNMDRGNDRASTDSGGDDKPQVEQAQPPPPPPPPVSSSVVVPPVPPPVTAATTESLQEKDAQKDEDDEWDADEDKWDSNSNGSNSTFGLALDNSESGDKQDEDDDSDDDDSDSDSEESKESAKSAKESALQAAVPINSQEVTRPVETFPSPIKASSSQDRPAPSSQTKANDNAVNSSNVDEDLFASVEAVNNMAEMMVNNGGDADTSTRDGSVRSGVYASATSSPVQDVVAQDPSNTSSSLTNDKHIIVQSYAQEVSLPDLNGVTIRRVADGSGRCIVDWVAESSVALECGIRPKDVVVAIGTEYRNTSNNGRDDSESTDDVSIALKNAAEDHELKMASDFDLMHYVELASRNTSNHYSFVFQIWFLEAVDTSFTEELESVGDDLCIKLEVSAHNLAIALFEVSQNKNHDQIDHSTLERLFGVKFIEENGYISVLNIKSNGTEDNEGDNAMMIMNNDQLTGVENIPTVFSPDEPRGNNVSEIWRLIRSRLVHLLEMNSNGNASADVSSSSLSIHLNIWRPFSDKWTKDSRPPLVFEPMTPLVDDFSTNSELTSIGGNGNGGISPNTQEALQQYMRQGNPNTGASSVLSLNTVTATDMNDSYDDRTNESLGGDDTSFSGYGGHAVSGRSTVSTSSSFNAQGQNNDFGNETRNRGDVVGDAITAVEDHFDNGLPPPPPPPRNEDQIKQDNVQNEEEAMLSDEKANGEFIEAVGEADEEGTLDLTNQQLPHFTVPPDYFGASGLDTMLELRKKLITLDLSHNAMTVVDVALLTDTFGDNSEGVSNLKHLNLSHNQLGRICGGGPNVSFPLSMSNLETLDVSFNAITRISGIEKMLELRSLNLSHNKIRMIAGLEPLNKLLLLKLHHNELHDFQQLKVLHTNRGLRSITLNGNDSMFPHGLDGINGTTARTNLMVMLPQLRTIDGKSLPSKTAAYALSSKPKSKVRSTYTLDKTANNANLKTGKGHYLKDEKLDFKEDRLFHREENEEMKISAIEHKPVLVSWDGMRWNAPQSLDNLAVPKYKKEKPKKVRGKEYVFGRTHVKEPLPQHVARKVTISHKPPPSEPQGFSSFSQFRKSGDSDEKTSTVEEKPKEKVKTSNIPRLHIPDKKNAAEKSRYMQYTENYSINRSLRREELVTRNLLPAPYLGGSLSSSTTNNSNKNSNNKSSSQQKAKEEKAVLELKAEVARLHQLHGQSVELVKKHQTQMLNLTKALASSSSSSQSGGGSLTTDQVKLVKELTEHETLRAASKKTVSDSNNLSVESEDVLETDDLSVEIDVSSNARRVKGWTRRISEEGETCNEALNMLLNMHKNKEISKERLEQFKITMDDLGLARSAPPVLPSARAAVNALKIFMKRGKTDLNMKDYTLANKTIENMTQCETSTSIVRSQLFELLDLSIKNDVSDDSTHIFLDFFKELQSMDIIQVPAELLQEVKKITPAQVEVQVQVQVEVEQPKKPVVVQIEKKPSLKIDTKDDNDNDDDLTTMSVEQKRLFYDQGRTKNGFTLNELNVQQNRPKSPASMMHEEEEEKEKMRLQHEKELKKVTHKVIHDELESSSDSDESDSLVGITLKPTTVKKPSSPTATMSAIERIRAAAAKTGSGSTSTSAAITATTNAAGGSSEEPALMSNRAYALLGASTPQDEESNSSSSNSRSNSRTRQVPEQDAPGPPLTTTPPLSKQQSDAEGLINGHMRHVELNEDEVEAFKKAFVPGNEQEEQDQESNSEYHDDDSESVGSNMTGESGVSSLGAMEGHFDENAVGVSTSESNNDHEEEDHSEDEDSEEFDWIEGFDTNHNLYYYFNVHTQESKWVKPDEPYKPYDPNEFDGEDSGSDEEDSEEEEN